MATYIGNVPVPQATQTRDQFVATSGQTIFNTSGYTPGFLDVYLNGVKLHTSDYIATDGNTITLTSGATVGDLLDTVAFSTFEVAAFNFFMPFFNSAGSSDTIQMNSDNTIPFFKADGTQDNIGVA